MNVNFLGEALLGEDEARRRLETYLAALQRPEVEVHVGQDLHDLFADLRRSPASTRCDVLCDRLELLYREAAQGRASRAPTARPCPSSSTSTWRNTATSADRRGVHAHARAAGPGRGERRHRAPGVHPRLVRARSGGSHEWARGAGRRGRSAGHHPHRQRREHGDGAGRGVACAAGRRRRSQTKVETDANYKRMLHEAIAPENSRRCGWAWPRTICSMSPTALVLAGARRRGDRGCSSRCSKAWPTTSGARSAERCAQLLLYAPACRKEEFLNAIGYLIRRLDENTGPENFLRHAFRCKVGSEEWNALEHGLPREPRSSSISDAPRRTRTATAPLGEPLSEVDAGTRFENEPDTDSRCRRTADWADEIVERWQARHGAARSRSRSSSPARRVFADRETRDCLDPSRPGDDRRPVPHGDRRRHRPRRRLRPSDPDGLADAGRGRRDAAILGRVAQELRAARGDLMCAALANGGKTLTEADPEVPRRSTSWSSTGVARASFDALGTVDVEPVGVVVVVPPWNFPIAIPCGGMAAALAAGNTVILKPASDTVLVAWELCQCFWRAGVPREVLQFLPCSGSERGAQLVASPGRRRGRSSPAAPTPRSGCCDANPGMRLFAETGGKNATIVTALTDRELAIKHVIHSAFSHRGQKCSATSLLCSKPKSTTTRSSSGRSATRSGACASARPGSSTRDRSAHPSADGDLERAPETLEPANRGRSCRSAGRRQPEPLVARREVGRAARQLHPLTEFFGPVLGVMRFAGLAEAIDAGERDRLRPHLRRSKPRRARAAQNGRSGIRAGNLYINRGTTGAIVLRQPFGGMGKSASVRA